MMQFKTWITNIDDALQIVNHWIFYKISDQILIALSIYEYIKFVVGMRQPENPVAGMVDDSADLLFVALIVFRTTKYVLFCMAKIYDFFKLNVSPVIASLCSGMVGCFMVLSASETIFPVAFQFYFATNLGVQF